jgi:hypothetical protein
MTKQQKVAPVGYSPTPEELEDGAVTIRREETFERIQNKRPPPLTANELRDAQWTVEKMDRAGVWQWKARVNGRPTEEQLLQSCNGAGKFRITPHDPQTDDKLANLAQFLTLNPDDDEKMVDDMPSMPPAGAYGLPSAWAQQFPPQPDFTPPAPEPERGGMTAFELAQIEIQRHNAEAQAEIQRMNLVAQQKREEREAREADDRRRQDELRREREDRERREERQAAQARTDSLIQGALSIAASVLPAILKPAPPPPSIDINAQLLTALLNRQDRTPIDEAMKMLTVMQDTVAKQAEVLADRAAPVEKDDDDGFKAKDLMMLLPMMMSRSPDGAAQAMAMMQSRQQSQPQMNPMALLENPENVAGIVEASPGPVMDGLLLALRRRPELANEFLAKYQAAADNGDDAQQ